MEPAEWEDLPSGFLHGLGERRHSNSETHNLVVSIDDHGKKVGHQVREELALEIIALAGRQFGEAVQGGICLVQDLEYSVSIFGQNLLLVPILSLMDVIPLFHEFSILAVPAQVLRDLDQIFDIIIAA